MSQQSMAISTMVCTLPCCFLLYAEQHLHTETKQNLFKVEDIPCVALVPACLCRSVFIHNLQCPAALEKKKGRKQAANPAAADPIHPQGQPYV